MFSQSTVHLTDCSSSRSWWWWCYLVPGSVLPLMSSSCCDVTTQLVHCCDLCHLDNSPSHHAVTLFKLVSSIFANCSLQFKWWSSQLTIPLLKVFKMAAGWGCPWIVFSFPHIFQTRYFPQHKLHRMWSQASTRRCHIPGISIPSLIVHYLMHCLPVISQA